MTSTQTGNYTYTPQAGFSGVDKYEYTVCDTMKNCSQGIIIINVIEPFNAPPEVGGDSVVTVRNAPVTINPIANDTDPEGSILTITAVTKLTTTQGGIIEYDTSGKLTYTPPLNFMGRDTYDTKPLFALYIFAIMLLAKFLRSTLIRHLRI